MAGPSPLAKLNTPAKVGIAAGLLALVAVVYFVVFYGDLATAIQAARSRERQLSEELSTARKAEHAYQKDLAELADRQQRQRELNKILPADTQYPAFLSAVQNVANVAGVSLTAWTPQAEAPGEFYARVPMSIELDGRYHQIARFFYGVGQLDRIINIENISISKPTEDEGEVKLTVQALATAFHSMEGGAAANRKQQQERKKGGKQ